MTFNHKEKSVLLILTLAAVLLVTRLSAWATAQNQRASDSCIYDPVHRLIVPAFEALRDRPLLTRILTAVDGILIDVSMITFGTIYALTGRTATLIPSLVLFYLVRTIALNMIVFPVPRNYIFEDPGVPSIFVDYDKVNDLYFSGHTGCLVIYLLDAIQTRRGKVLYFLAPFLAYTLALLLLEGIHYSNDILIGAFTAFTVNRFLFRNRYEFNLFYLKALIAIYNFFRFITAGIKSMAALFRKKSKDPEAAVRGLGSIKNEFGADPSNASENTSISDAK